ncbi:MAG: PspC protein [Ferruginibacter sp.]|nr:PspC protein [Ferruginibacter sp.]
MPKTITGYQKHNYYAMKQVININFQGRVVPIEVTAFDTLKNYTESLSRYFANEEGKEEIINDIESRIGELFQERLKEGATCITEDDVNAIIKSMGRPEDFETEGGTESSNSSTAGQQSAPFNTYTATGNKRLFRDENDKVIGGVCSGLANYFGIDVVVVRIVFVVLAISFGFGLLTYLILWIAVPSTATTMIGGIRKKLYRDNDDKYIAGVCSGIANYFGINAWIPRILFLLPFLSFLSRWNHWDNGFPDLFRVAFSPGSLIIYIILWLVIPEANTTAEKLEMKGEKVDMNSIKNSVMEEIKGVQERAQKFGKEAAGVTSDKAKMFSSEATVVARRGRRGLGDIIAFLFKLFAYFIIGCIGFALVIGLFAFGIFAIGMFPMKDFLLRDGLQNACAWGTLIFFIAAPIIGIITWVIRRLAKIKTGRKTMRLSFMSLWLVGLICFITLLVSLRNDFRYSNKLNEELVLLSNPGINKLEISNLTPEQRSYRTKWFRMQPFEGWEEDTAYVQNITVHIVKATNDSFKVTMLRLSNGHTKNEANRLSEMINFTAVQKDSILLIDKGIAINRNDKFRNQRIIMTVYVPVGKQIRINGNIGWGNNVKFEGPWNDNWDVDFEDVESGWDHDVDYIMKKEGLFTLDGRPADTWKNKRFVIDEDGIHSRNGRRTITIDDNGVRTETNEGSFRYYQDSPVSHLDSMRMKIQLEEKRTKDSLEKVKEKIDQQLQKMEDKADEPSAYNQVLQTYNPMIMVTY